MSSSSSYSDSSSSSSSELRKKKKKKKKKERKEQRRIKKHIKKEKKEKKERRMRKQLEKARQPDYYEQQSRPLSGPQHIAKDRVLVASVKQLQQSNPDFRVAWAKHCESVANNVRDPAEHGDGFLQSFLSSWSSSTTAGPPILTAAPREFAPTAKAPQLVKAPQTAKAPQPSRAYTPLAPRRPTVDLVPRRPTFDPMTDPRDLYWDDLIAFFKQRQSSDRKFKQAWVRHCTDGYYDPNHRSASFVQEFILKYQTEAEGILHRPRP